MAGPRLRGRKGLSSCDFGTEYTHFPRSVWRLITGPPDDPRMAPPLPLRSVRDQGAEISVGFAACRGRSVKIDFGGGGKLHFHIAEMGVDIHLRDGEFSGPQLDVASLNGNFERIREIADVHVARNVW